MKQAQPNSETNNRDQRKSDDPGHDRTGNPRLFGGAEGSHDVSTVTQAREHPAYSQSMAPESSPENEGVQDIDVPALEGMFTKELSTAFAALGCFNLAIFGATGAGKSTLVNAVFGRDVADTGVGEPVTRGVDYHRRDDGFLGIFDSEGFETGSAGDQILEGLRDVVEARRRSAIDQQIHAAWYVVRWSDRRFEEAQAAFVRRLAELGLPVIVVLTQVPSRDGQAHPHAVELSDFITGLGLPIRAGEAPVLTNALADDFTIDLIFVATMAIFLAMGLLAHDWVRRNHFELFYWAHHISLAFFVAALWHATGLWCVRHRPLVCCFYTACPV